jgi:hypothetical protein
MKAILIAALAELLLFACVSVCLRLDVTEQRARLMLIAFVSVLPVLLAAHALTPPDLGFLGAGWVTPIVLVDIAFAVFLYTVGFFGGLLQLYNLADRGFSLRILIDILEAPSQIMNLEDVMKGYSGGRGIAWMYAKRLKDMKSAGLVEADGECLVLTPKGRRAANLFTWLQEFARVAPTASGER